MQQEKIKTEILIIGAGPSGATASLFLSKMGIEHVIVDAARFPRDKVCGDGLDLKVFRVLNELDPQILPEDIFQNQKFVESWGVRLIAPSGRQTDLCYSPRAGDLRQPPFRVAKRLVFDDFLVKKIDRRTADFRQQTKVEKVERTADGWRVECNPDLQVGAERHSPTWRSGLQIEAKLILAADGDHSMMLHELGERKIDRKNYAGTLRQYHRGVAGLHPQNLIEVYFPKKYPMSYFYIFPLPDGEANVGYGMVSEIAAAGKLNLREIFADLLKNDPHLAPRFAAAEPLEKPVGWGLPLASRRRRNFGDGFLLLGDAGSLVCPTSGEGIGTGMMSGLIAARFAGAALAAGRFDADFFKNYDREIYRRLRDEIQIFNFLMRWQPFRIYNFGLDLLVAAPFLPFFYRKSMRGWLRTAFEKRIEIENG